MVDDAFDDFEAELRALLNRERSDVAHVALHRSNIRLFPFFVSAIVTKQLRIDVPVFRANRNILRSFLKSGLISSRPRDLWLGFRDFRRPEQIEMREIFLSSQLLGLISARRRSLLFSTDFARREILLDAWLHNLRTDVSLIRQGDKEFLPLWPEEPPEEFRHYESEFFNTSVWEFPSPIADFFIDWYTGFRIGDPVSVKIQRSVLRLPRSWWSVEQSLILANAIRDILYSTERYQEPRLILDFDALGDKIEFHPEYLLGYRKPWRDQLESAVLIGVLGSIASIISLMQQNSERLTPIAILERFRLAAKQRDKPEYRLGRVASDADILANARMMLDIRSTHASFIERITEKCLSPYYDAISDVNISDVDLEEIRAQTAICVCRNIKLARKDAGGLFPTDQFKELWEQFDCS